jgi:hypothetical protein
MGSARATVVSATETEIVFDVPRNAVSGSILVSVRGRGEATSQVPFTVLEPPVASTLTPSDVPPGGELTIGGVRFGTVLSDVAVTFNGVPCTVRSVSDTQIVVVIPAGVDRGRFTVSVRGVGDTTTAQYRVGRAAPALPTPVGVPAAPAQPAPPPPAIVPAHPAHPNPPPPPPAPAVPATPTPPPPVIVVH